MTEFLEGRAGLLRGASCPLLSKPYTEEAHRQQGEVIVAEHSPPINNGPQEQTPARQDVDVLLDVSELEVDRVRAKVLLKVRLDDIRAILKEALETVGEHPQILRILTRALDELVTERIGDTLDALQSALGDLEGDGPVEEEALRGKLEDARDTLQKVLDELGDQAQGERFARGGVPEVSSTSAAEEPNGASAEGTTEDPGR